MLARRAKAYSSFGSEYSWKLECSR